MINKKWVVRMSALLTIAVVLFFGKKSIEVVQVMRNLDGQIEKTQRELDSAKQLLTTLEEEKESMETLEYIGRIAREKLGMVKSDDIVFKTK